MQTCIAVKSFTTSVNLSTLNDITVALSITSGVGIPPFFNLPAKPLKDNQPISILLSIDKFFRSVTYLILLDFQESELLHISCKFTIQINHSVDISIDF